MSFWLFLRSCLSPCKCVLRGDAPFIFSVFIFICFAQVVPAQAQDQLSLKADQLIYTHASDEIEALGRVDIRYRGYQLSAQKVIYRRRSGRVVAIGNVSLVDEGQDGVINAERLDVTDNFQRGFVESVEFRVPEFGQFLADRGERESQTRIKFVDATYNPCRVCEANSDKPLLWNIKAKTIILDDERKVVTYEKATFQLFGQPIATLPYFRHVDPREDRGTGFLQPITEYSNDLGLSVGVPYFIVTSPKSDLTLTGVAHSKQGFLADAEWRQALGPGYFTLRAAGIYQFAPDKFTPGSVDSTQRWRGLVATKGHYKPRNNWSAEWDIMQQSDRTFARTYNIDGYSDRIIKNRVLLTGLEDRNYFHLGAKQYLIQDNIDIQDQQAFILPESSREKIYETSGFGDFKLTSYLVSLNRRAEDVDLIAGGRQRFEGLEGHSTRSVHEVEWSKKFVSKGGLVVVPLLAARGDMFRYESDSVSSLQPSETGFLGSLTAGLEARYPVLIQNDKDSHIIEPIAQIYVRPNEMRQGALPNNDAQSLVFDTSILFDRDKYSGFDRIEGGTRANYGLRYTGVLGNGFSIGGIIGQSVQIAGQNSFAVADIANTGLESGLDSRFSDFVASLNVSYNDTYHFEHRIRLDQAALKIQRAEFEGSYTTDPFDFSLGYSFANSQPLLGFETDRHEISASTRIVLNDFWSLSGGTTYDIANGTLVRSFAGLKYENEAGSIQLTYIRDEDFFTSDQTTQSIDVQISLFPFDQ